MPTRLVCGTTYFIAKFYTTKRTDIPLYRTNTAFLTLRLWSEISSRDSPFYSRHPCPLFPNKSKKLSNARTFSPWIIEVASSLLPILTYSLHWTSNYTQAKNGCYPMRRKTVLFSHKILKQTSKPTSKISINGTNLKKHLDTLNQLLEQLKILVETTTI